MAFNPRQLMQLLANQQKNDEGLVTFRAGRLFMDDGTKMVTADNRRGKVKIIKDDTGMMKFQWLNRISGQTDLDLLVMPRSARWEKVSECQDGRVYLLRMTDSNRKHFFWMQEPTDEKDEEYFTNINKLCNGESLTDDKNKSSDASASASGANAGAAANPYAAFGAQNQGGMGQNAMAQLLLNAIQGNSGAFGANNQSSAAAGNNSSSNNNAGAQQQQMMEQMMRQQMQQRMEEMKREPDLEDILDANSEQIVALLDDEKVVEELAQHLPESMRTREAMLDQLQSPQFQGALRRLQSVLNGEQMPMILSQMGIQNSNQNAMGVTAFVDAIQANSGGGSNQDDDDGDSAMKDDKDKDKDQDKDKDKGKEKSNDPDIYK